MKIYRTTNTSEVFKQFEGSDYWVLCITDYLAQVYVHVLKVEGDHVTFTCCGSSKRELEPQNMSLHFILAFANTKLISSFSVVTPLDVLTTEELLEPVCEAQGVTVEETIDRYWGNHQ